MAGEVEVRYVHRVKFSEPAGHWVKASSWDFAWDLDSGLKTLDRPNIPRLLPSVRMRVGKSTGEIAQPAFGNDDKWKTVASIYLPDLPNKVGGIVVKAQCGGDRDGNDYRFHLVEYTVKPLAGTSSQFDLVFKRNTRCKDLMDLIKNFNETYCPAAGFPDVEVVWKHTLMGFGDQPVAKDERYNIPGFGQFA